MPGFFHCASHEPTDLVLLPAHLFHDLFERGAVLPLEHVDWSRHLAAFARPCTFLSLGGILALGVFFAVGSSRSRYLGGRPQWRLCANAGYRFGDFDGIWRRQGSHNFASAISRIDPPRSDHAELRSMIVPPADAGGRESDLHCGSATKRAGERAGKLPITPDNAQSSVSFRQGCVVWI
jgi:hypothetical protein